jgi:glyoxylase-like metal-dependent hydrolase (beta-lactamase superfamily II)
VFDQAARDLAPYQAAGRVRSFAADAEIVPGVRAIATPGHTPGHSFFRVESEGKVLVLWGDLIHAKDLQFRAPGIAIRYDLDSRAAVAQRKAALRDAAAKGYLVGAPHIPFPGIGRVLESGGGYEWLPVNYSETGLRRPLAAD